MNIESSAARTFRFSLFTFVQIIGGGCIILSIYWPYVYMGGFSWDGGGTNFNWHVVFMTLFIFFYGNAAITYRMTRHMKKFNAKLLHGAVNLLAFVFAVLGLVAVFRFHNHMLIPNMYSLHSWIGLITVTLYACQLVFAFVSFLYPKIADDNIRSAYLEIHVFFGVVMLALVVAAVFSGITEKMLFAFKAEYSQFVPVGYVANFLGVLIAVFVMMVVYMLSNRRWKRME